MINVLITDIYKRKTFDLINILLRNYKNEINLILCDKVDFFAFSPIYYCRKIWPLDKSCSENFNKSLQNIEKNFNEIVFIPIEENTTFLFYEYVRRHKETNFKFLLPSLDSYKISSDKDKLSKYCLLNNFCVPFSYEYNEINELIFKNSSLVIKPVKGHGADGVEYISSLDDFKRLNFDKNTHIIQQRIGNSNEVFGAYFLFKDGIMIDYYGHRRIFTFPASGGASVFAEVFYDNVIKEKGEEVLKSLNWSGIAMIEFMKDNNGQPILIEINPRIWGSILLSEFVNSKIIINYITMCVDESYVKSEVKKEHGIIWLIPYGFLIPFKVMLEKILGHYIGPKKIAYINFTYSSYFRSIFFMVFSTFKIGNLLKFVKRFKS
jgi:predicted ATP-grasp superfamily ATP-dependent carboligase